AGMSPNRSDAANSASRTVSPLILLSLSSRRGSRSIANVLQEPLGGDLPTKPLRLGELIDSSRQRPELVALQVAALRIGNLIVGGAAPALAEDDVGECDGPLGREHGAMSAPALGLALEAGFDIGARRVGEIFVVDPRSCAPRRGRVAE